MLVLPRAWRAPRNYYFILLYSAWRVLGTYEDFRKIAAMVGIIRLHKWVHERGYERATLKRGSCWIIRYNVIARKVNYFSYWPWYYDKVRRRICIKDWRRLPCSFSCVYTTYVGTVGQYHRDVYGMNVKSPETFRLLSAVDWIFDVQKCTDK